MKVDYLGVSEFINFYNSCIKRGINKCDETKIYLSYENGYLVMEVTEDGQISAIDYLECSEKIANAVLNKICNDFIANHKMSVASISNHNKKQLHIHNTYVEIIHNLNSLEDYKRAERLVDKTFEKIKSNHNTTKQEIIEERNSNFQNSAIAFFKHYELAMKRLEKKESFFNIYPYYVDGYLVIQIINTDDNQTVIYDSLKCTDKQAQLIIYHILQNFINNHKIILSSLNKVNRPLNKKLINQDGRLKIQNTKFNLNILFDKSQENRIRKMHEEALEKMETKSYQKTY